ASSTGVPASELRDRGVSTAVVRRLVTGGLAVIRQERDERDPFEACSVANDGEDGTPRVLTAEQDHVLSTLGSLAEARQFRVALLHGVTGGGKTEVYERLAGQVCAAGRRVLILVPEIALTTAMVARFRARYGRRMAVLHSGLGQGERHDQWHRIHRGEVDVVIGTRSAVFAPVGNLGLVVVDEEHDSSYKQEESPRYHGRDVAIMRASRSGALVVLGSATPSMESFHHASSGKYTLVTLTRRVHDRPLARVRIVNMRDEMTEAGPDVVFSRAMADAIADRLERREQVVVLLNRRGYATSVFCRQCGDTLECPNCSISLTVHRSRRTPPGTTAGQRGGVTDDAVTRGRARCHYCNYSTAVPGQCRVCAAPYLDLAGFGTERVERELRERFPSARVGRVDRDSVRRRGALGSLLGAFAAGDLDVLVGTQMIAKGHDFPRVTLVGVVSADAGLGVADFRAAERTFQLLTQVAGRAGRGDRPGEAIVQTVYPEHYSVSLACRQDYQAFFAKERAYRHGLHYPPVVALINVIVRGRTFGEAMETARDLSRLIDVSGPGITLLGPAPAPLGRLRGEHRVQVLLKGRRRAALREALGAALDQRPDIRRRVTVDVDPQSVL
ncbi:MAG: primosomal protein N', partial [Acidimicrobiia bacterium]|nr:primosomal protein N' [Acidimicrobiia bacterium]